MARASPGIVEPLPTNLQHYGNGRLVDDLRTSASLLGAGPSTYPEFLDGSIFPGE